METQNPAVLIADTPKQQVSWLEYFPPDIWSYLAWNLCGEELGRLKMTGATLLWQRLKSPGVVRSIKLGRDPFPFKSRPKCLDDFPTLEELVIYSPSDNWSHEFGMTLDSIPPGVRKLEFSGNWKKSIAKLFEEHGRVSNISKYLPYLQYLDLSESPDPHNSWMPHSPQSLTSLKLKRWDGTVELPSSLIHFEAGSLDISEDSFVSKLPPSLESFLILGILSFVDLVIPLLPPSTRALLPGDRSSSRDGIWVFPPRLLEHLPKFLTYLRIPSCNGIDFETQPELLSLLPPTLMELEIYPITPPSAWHLLPPNLTKLDLSVLDPTGTKNTIHGDQVQREILTVPFDALPRSITSLHVHSDRYFCSSPTASHHSYFPPQLTFLALKKCQLSPEAAKLLPSSLTHLEIGNFCERVCEGLKTGLKTLIASRTLMSPNLIKFLPKSLTFLKLRVAEDEDTWFDYKTGKSLGSIEEHPEYSIHDNCTSESFDWKDTSPLPQTLTHLEIARAYELADSFLQHQTLPQLLELRLRDSEYFSDLAFPLRSPYLTTLDLDSSSDITGKSFPLLPRYLIELGLASQSVFDSDIRHLPRTLKVIRMPYAIDLTDSCKADLPPHLEQLHLGYNRHVSDEPKSSSLSISKIPL